MENMWTAASEKLATQLKEIQVQVFSIESFIQVVFAEHLFLVSLLWTCFDINPFMPGGN